MKSKLKLTEGATGECGLVNDKGEWVILPKYDEIKEHLSFNRNWFAEAPIKGKEMMERSYFVEGRAIVAAEEWDERESSFIKKWGFVDEDGKEITGQIFDSVDWFREGLAKVAKDGGLGLIDLNGDWVLKPVHKKIGLLEGKEKIRIRDIGKFHDGIAYIMAMEDGGDYRYGYIRKDGSWLIEPQFITAWDFKNELGIVERSGYYFVDKDGNECVDKAHFDSFAGDLDDDIICVIVYNKEEGANGYMHPRNQSHGFVDRLTGAWIVKPMPCEEFERREYFEGIKNGEKGYVDKSCNWHTSIPEE